MGRSKDMSRTRTNKSCIGTGRWMGLLALVLTATLGWGQSSKLSKDLQAATSTNVDVVIQYYTPPTSVDTNAATSQGASNGKAVGLVRGYKWTMPKGNVSTLISK